MATKKPKELRLPLKDVKPLKLDGALLFRGVKHDGKKWNAILFPANGLKEAETKKS